MFYVRSKLARQHARAPLSATKGVIVRYVCIMCDSRSVNGLRGRPYHRGNLPTLQFCGIEVCGCVNIFFTSPNSPSSMWWKGKGDKANGLSALLNMT